MQGALYYNKGERKKYFQTKAEELLKCREARCTHKERHCRVEQQKNMYPVLKFSYTLTQKGTYQVLHEIMKIEYKF